MQRKSNGLQDILQIQYLNERKTGVSLRRIGSKEAVLLKAASI